MEANIERMSHSFINLGGMDTPHKLMNELNL